MTSFIYNVHANIIEFYLVLTICIILVFGVLVSTSKHLGYPLTNFSTALICVQVLIFTFILVIYYPYLNSNTWDNLLIQDSFCLNIKYLVLIFSISWFFLSFSYIKNEKINSFEFYLLILLIVLSFFFILQTFDLLSMYLSVEFQSLIFYILASFKRNSEFSTEAGLKYFVLGAFSSALLLFGSSLIYILTGLSNFSDFSKFFTGTLMDTSILVIGVLMGFIFIGVSLLFKLSAAPFHMWSPDVYEGSPTPITAFFSIFPKLIIFVLLFRIFVISFYDFFYMWRSLFIFSIITSIFIGSFSALIQNKWKRFLAYSSINHIGFMLMSLLNGEILGISGFIIYIIIYIITTFGLFSVLLSFRILIYPKNYQTRYLSNLKGFLRLNPTISLSMTIILFSMAGIPPLTGFFAKVFVILPSLQNNFYGVAIFSIFMSCIACFYYIRLIRVMYFSHPEVYLVTYTIEKNISFLLSFSTFFVLFLFLDFEIISIFAMHTAFSFLY